LVIIIYLFLLIIIYLLLYKPIYNKIYYILKEVIKFRNYLLSFSFSISTFTTKCSFLPLDILHSEVRRHIARHGDFLTRRTVCPFKVAISVVRVIIIIINIKI
jgi:hypothetical protein